MKKIKICLLSILIVLLMASCMSIRVDFGNGLSFTLMDYRYYYPDIEEYQLISGSFPYLGDDMVFESWMKMGNDGIDMVAFLPTGQTFAKIGWDGEHLTYESAFMPMGKLFAQYIINDLQMCYAPLESIQLNLTGSGLVITESHVGFSTVRTLKSGSTVVEQITIDSGIITVENISGGYRYEIETL